jgi:hypothetical protein
MFKLKNNCNMKNEVTNNDVHKKGGALNGFLRFLRSFAIIILALIYYGLVKFFLSWILGSLFLSIIELEAVGTFAVIVVFTYPLWRLVRFLDICLIMPMAWTYKYNKWGVYIPMTLIGITMFLSIISMLNSSLKVFFMLEWYNYVMVAWICLWLCYFAFQMLLLNYLKGDFWEHAKSALFDKK